MNPSANESLVDKETQEDAKLSSPSTSRTSKLLPPRVRNIGKIDPDALYYNLSGKGLAVIFNHNVYRNSAYGERKGTQYDLEKLQTCFNKLNFDIKTYEDLAFEHILEVLIAVANLKANQLSCLVIIVMTHGDDTCLVAYDQKYSTSILWEKLAGKLVGIPKLYFIQACRGDGVDFGVEVTDSISEDIILKEISTFKLPSMADFLYMYATVEGHKAWRDMEGSCFIQTLCDELVDGAKEYDLLHILTLVNRKIALNYETRFSQNLHQYKAMPQFVSMLTKFLKFNLKP